MIAVERAARPRGRPWWRRRSSIRHRDDHIGAAEAEPRQEFARCLVGKRLADQILAGDAEMDAARLSDARSRRRRETPPRPSGALRSRRDSRAHGRSCASSSPPARNERGVCSFRRPLAGTPMMSFRGHQAQPPAGRPAGARCGWRSRSPERRPSRRWRRAARHSGRRRRSGTPCRPGLDLEDEAGIIFELAAEIGGEAHRLPNRYRAPQQVERRARASSGATRSMPAPFPIMAMRSIARRAVPAPRGRVDELATLSRQRLARGDRRRGQQPVGDLARGAGAEQGGRWSRDSRDQLLGAGRIFVGERGGERGDGLAVGPSPLARRCSTAWKQPGARK